MPTEYDTIHRALVSGSQSHVLTHIIRTQLPGGRVLPVRLQIRLNAYEEQSWGKVECFEDGRWSEVHHISGYEIPRDGFSYTGKPDDERCFKPVERKLFDVAFAVLGIL